MIIPDIAKPNVHGDILPMTNEITRDLGTFTARQAGAILILALWMLATPSDALDITWTGSGNTPSWNDPSNWSPQEVPGRFDQAIFNESSGGPGSQGYVQLDAPVEVGTLLFNNSSDFKFDTGLTSSGKLTVENEVVYNGEGVLRLSGENNVYEFNGLRQTNGVIEAGTQMFITAHNPDHPGSGNVTVGPGSVFRLRNDVNMIFAGSFPELKLEGQIEGIGTVHLRGNGVGQFQNFGHLVPGASPGTIVIDGDYVQSEEGELSMEVDGIQEGDFDLLVVTGDATLAGNLNFQLDANLEANEFIEFMQLGGTQTGQFDQVSTTGNSNIFMATGSSSYFTAESYNLGDMDRDHNYDRDDIDAMVLGLRDQLAYLTLTTGVPLWESGDVHPPGNPDGDFDFDDVRELIDLDLYPPPIVVSSAVTIPDPSSGWLLLLGGVAAIRRRRRRKASPHRTHKRDLPNKTTTF